MATGAVYLDLRDFETRLAVLKRPQAPLVRALNRSAASGQTLAARLISQDTGMKVSDVKRFITTTPATEANLSASVRASAKRVPLIQFGAKGREPSLGRPPGVRAKLAGGPGTYPHAFITTVGSGHRGVFQRKAGATRLPIVELRGPSLWHAFQKYQADVTARVQEQLGKNVAHEIEFAMKR